MKVAFSDTCAPPSSERTTKYTAREPAVALPYGTSSRTATQRDCAGPTSTGSPGETANL